MQTQAEAQVEGTIKEAIQQLRLARLLLDSGDDTTAPANQMRSLLLEAMSSTIRALDIIQGPGE